MLNKLPRRVDGRGIFALYLRSLTSGRAQDLHHCDIGSGLLSTLLLDPLLSLVTIEAATCPQHRFVVFASNSACVQSPSDIFKVARQHH